MEHWQNFVLHHTLVRPLTRKYETCELAFISISFRGWSISSYTERGLLGFHWATDSFTSKLVRSFGRHSCDGNSSIHSAWDVHTILAEFKMRKKKIVTHWQTATAGTPWPQNCLNTCSSFSNVQSCTYQLPNLKIPNRLIFSFLIRAYNSNVF